MLDVGLEDLAGSRAFHSHRLPHPAYRHTGDKRSVLAAVPRHAAVGAFAFGSPSVASSHGGVSAALVHENEATDVEPSHLLAPACSLLFITLGRYKTLFLSGSLSRLKARLMVAFETFTP